jgi:hypothetical protein
MHKTTKRDRVAEWAIRNAFILIPIWWGLLLAGVLISCEVALAARSRDVGPYRAGLAPGSAGVVTPSNANGGNVGPDESQSLGGG